MVRHRRDNVRPRATRENVENFKFGFSAWHLGSLVLGASHSDKIKFGRSARTISRSPIDHYLVQVYTSGGLAAEVEGKRMDVAVGDVWILDFTREAHIEEIGFRSVNLAIPRSLLAPLLKDPDGLHGLKLSAASALGGLLSRYLVGQTSHMTLAEAAAAAESTLHLIAACAGPHLEANDLVRGGLMKASLGAIRKFIEEELANPALDAELICKEFSLSRATLYRLFEPLGGVQAHVRRRRLGRCFHELVTPGRNAGPISEIALRWGFSDEAAFSRAFRSVYGLSPSEARAQGHRRHAHIADEERGPVASDGLRGEREQVGASSRFRAGARRPPLPVYGERVRVRGRREVLECASRRVGARGGKLTPALSPQAGRGSPRCTFHRCER